MDDQNQYLHISKPKIQRDIEEKKKPMITEYEKDR